jgi:hypothetical protein
MFLDQVMNEKRITGCLSISLGSESYANESIPGHFFNSEHSPYLFSMFNFKKHRSMHCELLCNQLYRTPEILK